MNLDWKQWRHVFKLDPDRPLADEAVERICRSGTDAIFVGGSTGVTYANTAGLLHRIRKFAVPCVLEVSAADAVVPGFDFYMVPVVVNTDDGDWITGQHQRALRRFGDAVDWSRLLAEGYVILNGDSAAARLTGAKAMIGEEDFLAYVRLIDRLFRFPIVYVEYSGKFGNMEWVRKAAGDLRQARLFYGGGVVDAGKAEEAAAAAHAVVVGNIIYENLDQALETVTAVKQARRQV